jgi:hypothetical protein
MICAIMLRYHYMYHHYYCRFSFYTKSANDRMVLNVGQAWWRQWFDMWKFITCIVVIKGTNKSLHSLRSCHSPQRHWSAPCAESGESPQSCTCVPRIYVRLPGKHSVNQSRVEYTSLELSQIALEQIRVLPARLYVSDRPFSSDTHSQRLSILSQHHTLNLRTNISLPRPPWCIIVTHKVYTMPRKCRKIPNLSRKGYHLGRSS